MKQHTQSTKDTTAGLDLTQKLLGLALIPDLEDGLYRMTLAGKITAESVQDKDGNDIVVLHLSWKINEHVRSVSIRGIFWIEKTIRSIARQLGISYQAGHTIGSILEACRENAVKGLVSSNDKGYLNINFDIEAE